MNYINFTMKYKNNYYYFKYKSTTYIFSREELSHAKTITNLIKILKDKYIYHEAF